MTHDELLAKIDEALPVFDANNPILWSAYKQYLKALRAVVELHEPFEQDGKLWCDQEVCYFHIEYGDRDSCECVYPCPTIQAIEKELG